MSGGIRPAGTLEDFQRIDWGWCTRCGRRAVWYTAFFSKAIIYCDVHLPAKYRKLAELSPEPKP